MKKGLFITFEGPDGSGKTTILNKVANYFKEKEIDFVQTREPGGSNIAQQIRNILLDEKNIGLSSTTEALLFAASRAQHYDEIVKPALDHDQIVLCDRFIDSSLAYQGYARGLGMQEILDVNNFAISNQLPDLTIFFDIKPELGLERINQSADREINRLDLEGLKFHQKVYEGYQEVIKKYPKRIVCIDASQSIEQVFAEVIQILKERLDGKL